MIQSIVNGDAPLPREIEAEKRLLGVLILGEGDLELVRSRLKPDDFWLRSHQLIYRAILAVADLGATPSLPVIHQECLAQGTALECGGPNYLMELANYETAALPGSEVPNCELLLRASRGRALASALREAQLADPAEEPAEVALRVRNRLDIVSQLAAVYDKITLRSRTYQDIALEDIEPLRPLLGAALLRQRGLLLLSGKPGTGKTHLLMELAEALATSSRWLGLEAYSATVCCFFAELESQDVQTRGRRLIQHGGARIHVVTQDKMPKAPNILTETGRMSLEAWLRAKHAEVCILDPLARFLGAAPESNETMQLVVETFDQIRHRTGSAIVVGHHERKGIPGANDDDLDAVRGGTVLTAAIRSIVRIKRIGTSRVRAIRFPKANDQREPDELWFSIPEDGGPVQLQKCPDQRASEIRDAILRTVQNLATEVSCGTVAERVGKSERTVRRYLNTLAEEGEIQAVGARKNRRYRPSAIENGVSWPTTQEPVEQQQIPGTETSENPVIGHGRQGDEMFIGQHRYSPPRRGGVPDGRQTPPTDFQQVSGHGSERDEEIADKVTGQVTGHEYSAWPATREPVEQQQSLPAMTVKLPTDFQQTTPKPSFPCPRCGPLALWVHTPSGWSCDSCGITHQPDFDNPPQEIDDGSPAF